MKRIALGKMLAMLGVGFIMIAVLVFTYTALTPVDVLKDWKITTDKKTYAVGDDIILTSNSQKLMSVTGIARRYIECQSNTSGSSWYRTPVNEIDVDRQPGKTNTTSTIKIPDTIQGVPNTCRLYITVEYRIYNYRSFTEFATSNEFRLNPRDTQASPPETTSTNALEQPSSGQLNSNTPQVGQIQGPTVPTQPTNTAVTDTDEVRPIDPVYTPPPENPQPGLLQQLTESVRNILNIQVTI